MGHLWLMLSVDCTVKSVNVHDREYTLLQFHLHATSEHTVNNYHYDAELNFVHKDISGSGKLLVMGVFLHAEEAQSTTGSSTICWATWRLTTKRLTWKRAS